MQTLQVERSDGLVTITLDRPDKRNAVSSQMWAELAEVATELATSDDRCVVLTGAGGAFCYGAALWEADAPRAHQLAPMRRVKRVLAHPPVLAKPTVQTEERHGGKKWH